MERVFLVMIVIILTVDVCQAQEWENKSIILTNPNVYPYGININTTYTSSWAREFSISSNSNGKLFSLGARAIGDQLTYGYIGGNTSSTTAYGAHWMVFKPEGDIGIGTENPIAKLDIHGGLNVYGNSGIKSVSEITYDVIAMLRNNGGNGLLIGSENSNHDVVISSTYSGGDLILATRVAPNNNEAMRIVSNGKVGIGTQIPDELLTVDGNIHATGYLESTEVIVRTEASTIPDYVFQPDYDLMSLEEVEAYVKANSHLPEVPSAEEVEANGHKLAEMNLLLLKKIEELTLHAIEQEKKILNQESTIQQQKSILIDFENRLQKLENSKN